MFMRATGVQSKQGEINLAKNVELLTAYLGCRRSIMTWRAMSGRRVAMVVAISLSPDQKATLNLSELN